MKVLENRIYVVMIATQYAGLNGLEGDMAAGVVRAAVDGAGDSAARGRSPSAASSAEAAAALAPALLH